MPCAYITDLSTQIFLDLGQPSGQPPSYIQSKLVSAPYVGKLNNLISACYVSVTGDISPPLDEAAQGIYSSMYQADYFTTKLNQTLAGLNPGIVELQESDSKIRFTNPVEQAKVYKELQRQLNEQLFWQVSAYRGDASGPGAVDMMTIVNAPNAGGLNQGNPRNYYRG
jgi:hypothetical protein